MGASPRKNMVIDILTRTMVNMKRRLEAYNAWNIGRLSGQCSQKLGYQRTFWKASLCA